MGAQGSVYNMTVCLVPELALLGRRDHPLSPHTFVRKSACARFYGQ